jgi:hypothetical protein
MQDAPPKPNRVDRRIQVWCPELATPEHIEQWQWGIKEQAKKQRQAAVILYDELAALIYKKGVFSEEYRRIQKIGGGLYITTLSLTQELGGIPSTAISQSQHVLCWRLQTTYDMVVANTLFGFRPKFGGKYSFWYKNVDNDEPAYQYENIQSFV